MTTATDLPPLLAESGQRLHPATAGTTGATPRVLVVDNYDSFTFNLVQYLLQLGAVVDVYRNDAVTAEQVLADRPSHILLSPGPGRPEDSGVCQALCRVLADPEVPAIPMLGVCLGHQTLCEVHGATVERAGRIMHGKLSPVLHDGTAYVQAGGGLVADSDPVAEQAECEHKAAAVLRAVAAAQTLRPAWTSG